MIASAAQECATCAESDVMPRCLLCIGLLCSIAIVLVIPIELCEWTEGTTSTAQQVLPMALITMACAASMVIIREMWTFWNPVGKAMNSHSWTLGIAAGLDLMVNDFYVRGRPDREHGFELAGEV